MQQPLVGETQRPQRITAGVLGLTDRGTHVEHALRHSNSDVVHLRSKARHGIVTLGLRTTDQGGKFVATQTNHRGDHLVVADGGEYS